MSAMITLFVRSTNLSIRYVVSHFHLSKSRIFCDRNLLHSNPIMNSDTLLDSKDVYEKAEEYWSQASKDVDGMLGGFAHLHKPDIMLSKSFLTSLRTRNFLLNNDYALDCGAGIGRVTKHLLLPLFVKVDMEDVVEELILKSDEYVGMLFL
uniref:Alpha N-terminal protein methyltransferase 1 n=1 Tax=Heterorhabditis bacteriophora TaxID=37862 RepID=A0A1I7X694_HETBA